MGSLFVGAIVALSASLLFGGESAPGRAGGSGGGSPEQSDAARAAFHSPPGSCLTWDAADANDARTVPCAESHLFEVTGVVSIGDKYPPGAASPDLPLWRQIAQERCREGANTYLGKPLDPYGRLALGVLRPTEDQWDEGDRELRCGIQWAGPGGGLQKITGPAAEQEQSDVWKVGSCLALTGKTVGDPIGCTKPHAYEIVAEVNLGEKFPDGFPSREDQQAFLDTECTRLAGEYTGGRDLAKDGLILTWDLREEASWNAGSTLVNCSVGAKLPDGSGLAPVTGTVKSTGTGAPPQAPAPAPGAPPAPGDAPAPEAPPADPPAEGEPSESAPPEGEPTTASETDG
nr:septum formation family protein [Amycolatopsis antarctica]